MVNNIKTKFKETFDTTPKAVRWLLLIAAFIVVLILIFLLVNKPKPVHNNTVSDKKIELIVEPQSADFSDTKIGTEAKQVFKISSTEDAIIDSVTVKDSVSGFSLESNQCKNWSARKEVPCFATATFAPKNTNVSGNVTLIVDWHDKNDSRETNPQNETIIIPVSVVEAATQQPEPIEPEPQPIPEPIPDPDPIPEPVQPITNPRPVWNPPATDKGSELIKVPEKCSDFAMPGYNTKGNQIGWIKPNKGRYEFHPFSDKDCNNPTGVYNPTTGIITDNNGKKIGTDAEHINFSVDVVPTLKSKSGKAVARPATTSDNPPGGMGNLKNTFNSEETGSGYLHFNKNDIDTKALMGSASEAESVYSSRPYDRTFILRQFKPIPATIVSEVRADPSVYGCYNSDDATCDGGSGIPVRATVDRNVYSDNGRTIIIPTGTLLMGYLKGDLPGPYKSIGRMEIKWYQFIRPDGVEFNFKDDSQDPYSADSQGRVGVPGYGSTDYIEQMVMPMLTAIIPAAVNMIAPIADTFVNQIDLDNNTVVQSGTVRSSELAKNEVISAWNKVAQKLMVDALDNTVPPFSIAAGTRITVYSPVDLIATCGEENAGKKCAIKEYNPQTRREWKDVKGKMTINKEDPSWVGQVRSFNLEKYCSLPDNNGIRQVAAEKVLELQKDGYDYRTVLAYCQSLAYQGKTQAKYEAYYDNKLATGIQGVDEDGNAIKLEKGSTEYNEQVLGLTYAKDADGADSGIIVNPFDKSAGAYESVGSLDCDGQAPDQNGCCPGETYEYMGDDYLDENGSHYACCPSGGGDCFPPLDLN